MIADTLSGNPPRRFTGKPPADRTPVSRRRTVTASAAPAKAASHLRVVPERPQAANHTWAMDFVHDRLMDGRGLRALTVIDEWSRERPAIEVDVSLTGERVSRVLE
jgi:transposase InsO family protein